MANNILMNDRRAYTLATTADASSVHTPHMLSSDRVARFTPTITGNTVQYTAGDNVGGLLTLSNFARVAAGSGLITGAVITSDSAQTCFFDILIFNANPSGSTFTNNGAQDVVAADLPSIAGVLHLNDVTALSGASIHQMSSAPLSVVLPSGTTAYAAIVVRGAPTLAANGDLTLALRVQQN